MWDLPGPEVKPMVPALAGEFFTTEPPRKPLQWYYIKRQVLCMTDLSQSPCLSAFPQVHEEVRLF